MVFGAGGESVPPPSATYARIPSVENAAALGLSCSRLLSLRSAFSKSTVRKSLSPGLALNTHAVRPFCARAMFLGGMPRSREPVTLPLAGSTSVSFWSVWLATATISELATTGEVAGDAAGFAPGEADGDAKRAAFGAGVGFDVACGGTNGSKLGAAAAPANRRPPVAPRTPAPPNVITTSASNRACMTRMFIARSRRPAVRSTRSGSSHHRQLPLREPLSVLIASGLRGDQLCP